MTHLLSVQHVEGEVRSAMEEWRAGLELIASERQVLQDDVVQALERQKEVELRIKLGL